MSPFHIREFCQADLDALAKLIHRADRVDHTGFAGSAEDLAHDLFEIGLGRTKSVLLAEAGRELIGYTVVHRARGTISRLVAVGAVDPDWRRRGVGTALMLRAEERASELVDSKRFVLDVPIRQSVAGGRELACSLGYHPARVFLYMVCPDVRTAPKPLFPAHIGLRDYVRRQDEEEFAAAYTETFADHWGEEPHTTADEQRRSGAPSFQPQDNLLAINSDGEIVGFCLLDQQGSEADEGVLPMIDDFGVRPAYRGQGIGRALLLAGLERLADRGAIAVGLFVDSASQYPSIHLYESVGFARRENVTIFRKNISGEAG